MTPEEQRQFDSMKQRLDKIEDLFFRMSMNDKFLLTKPLVILNGFIDVKGKILSNKGTNVVSANSITLGGDGNTYIITGNTQLNAIATVQWKAGADITLIFTGTPTVKHNTAGASGTAKIFLAGSVDLTASNNTVLGLKYDGTQWQEMFRKVP